NAPHSPYIVDDAYSDPYVSLVEHQDRANFYGMITRIDENLGVLRQKLKAWGLEENTIFIFMTDNGSSGGASLDAEQFVAQGYNAGMRGLKGSEYEGGHRVPLFIYWPGGDLCGGTDVRQLTANVDIMPTLMDLCDIDPGERKFDGDSLVPLLYGQTDNWSDRILVTDSQRLTSPVKWRKSATMTQQWRLINGVELYNIQQDPGQRHDLAAAHPDVVSRLREGYVQWWQKVSQQFDGTIPIPVGQNAAEPVLLNAHDWRNDPVLCAWNQSLVREGLVCNGYWEIDVQVTARYHVELRRWPREEDREITKGIPGHLIAYRDIKYGYGGGRALDLDTARLSAGDSTYIQPIKPTDKAIVFSVDLVAGETQLQTYLYDASGHDIGAYYVYVQRLSE
ncbi:MAG: sulfatase-like hydrolase/transferase, partial [Anaerolineae bacterium]|nr:sulfatase-like hydrolase/transferase [Anaerolineae bacterium]